MRTLLIVVACLVCLAAPAAAQMTNPSAVMFAASADHAISTGYVIGYFAPGATQPTQEDNLGKPTPDAEGLCLVSINTRPLTFGLGYVAKVRAVAGVISGEWSDPSNPFDRRPGKPGKPIF